MIYLDFEYNQPTERHMGLVSCCLLCVDDSIQELMNFNLRDSFEKSQLILYLSVAQEAGETLVCYNASAEARCLVALNLNPLDFKWVDLYLDHRQLMNKDVLWMYGKYIHEDIFGRPSIKVSQGYKPKLGMHQTDEEFEKVRAIHKARMTKKGLTVEPLTASLMTATLNFTEIPDDEVLHDWGVKKSTRDLIINRGDKDFTPEEMDQIIAYGEQDVRWMPEIYKNMGIALANASYQSVDTVLKHRLHRGKVGACMAMVESNGTPIRMDSLENLTKNSVVIENDSKALLNIRTGLPLCQWQLKGKQVDSVRFHNFKRDYETFARYLESSGLSKNWPLTTTDKYSMATEDIEKHKSNEVMTQYRKMLKTSSAMKYSKPDETGKSHVSRAIGSDNRLRVSLFPYGTQTGRNAARAKQYIYAQGAWIKAALIDIPEGYKLVETDYSSQEFFIGGVLSGDKRMMEAYKTDVYISFGIAANKYPDYCKGMTVAEIRSLGHEDQVVADIRQMLKAVVLGLSYGASDETISLNTGISLKEVSGLTRAYKRSYAPYYNWRKDVWNRHRRPGQPLTLDISGWYLGRHNESKLSTQNFPVQGTGSTMLHLALEKLLREDVHVINTLHDAVYYLVPEDDNHTVPRVEQILLDAAEEVLGEPGMKVESEEWHHGERVITPKGAADWKEYKKYVEN